MVSEDKPHHGHKWMPVMYANYYGLLMSAARECGYSLAVHGTVNRDLDLIAVPWVEEAQKPEELLRKFCRILGAEMKPNGEPAYDVKEEKPHNRVAYSIITGGGGYIDLSIIKLDNEDTE